MGRQSWQSSRPIHFLLSRRSSTRQGVKVVVETRPLPPAPEATLPWGGCGEEDASPRPIPAADPASWASTAGPASLAVDCPAGIAGKTASPLEALEAGAATRGADAVQSSNSVAFPVSRAACEAYAGSPIVPVHVASERETAGCCSSPQRLPNTDTSAAELNIGEPPPLAGVS